MHEDQETFFDEGTILSTLFVMDKEMQECGLEKDDLCHFILMNPDLILLICITYCWRKSRELFLDQHV